MRRHPAVPLLAIALSVIAVAGCSSSAQEKKTLTEVVTVTGSSPNGGSVTVISPVVPTTTDSVPASGAGTASGSATPSPGASSTRVSPSPTSSKPAASTGTKATAVTTPTSKPKKVDVLKADCTQLLDAQDVQKVLGVTISTAVTKIVDVANKDIGRTGLIRCRYGATSAATAAPVSLALANYTSAALALAQIKKTAASIGGTTSQTSVSGYPATVIIQDGGLLLMNYDTWTLSLAIADKLVPNTELPAALTQLATMVFLRVLKLG